MHFYYLINVNESILYMFRIDYLFIIRGHLLYVQHMVFTKLKIY